MSKTFARIFKTHSQVMLFSGLPIGQNPPVIFIFRMILTPPVAQSTVGETMRMVVIFLVIAGLRLALPALWIKAYGTSKSCSEAPVV